MINLNEKFLSNLFKEKELLEILELARQKFEILLQKKGAGSEMTGWLDYSTYFSDEILDKINKSAKRLSTTSDVIISIGIGGSYLGIKALLDPFPGNGKIIFAGNNLSTIYINQLLDFIKDKSFSLIVISKSGTTTEPSILFRILLDKLIDKFGEDSIKERVVLITDKEKGALQYFKKKYNCDSFIIPDEIGGRFSIFTPVGLYPLAAAGHDIYKLSQRLIEYESKLKNPDYNNPALRYAAIRNYLYEKHKIPIEVLISYEEKLRYVTEWWKQLFGESEGKDNKGLFPASAIFTTDLHSFGQYLQQGPRNFFETILNFENEPESPYIPYFENNFDGFNIIANKKLNEINKVAFKATSIAHFDGSSPIIIINISDLDLYNISELFLFFFYSCGISGYLLDLNPFDQPGVEQYKKNMLLLLGKNTDISEKNRLEKKIEELF
ncbi:MAG: glucose-6-phosphate isomerase [Exilispira sp.]